MNATPPTPPTPLSPDEIRKAVAFMLACAELLNDAQLDRLNTFLHDLTMSDMRIPPTIAVHDRVTLSLLRNAVVSAQSFHRAITQYAQATKDKLERRNQSN